MRPLTVLIGPNDSGKSAFLAVLHYLANEQPVRDLGDRWRLNPDVRLEILGKTEAGQVTLTSERAHREPVSCPSEIRPLGLYQLPSQGISMISPGYTDSGDPPALGPDGAGVASLLDHLLRRDRKRFFEFVDAMRKAVPGLEEIEISTPDPAERSVDLVIENGLRVPADRVSAGVRLLLFFMALAYHPSPPKLILIEEPENGIHPRRLADVMRLLRELTQGVHAGHKAQVVLTTHSPYLLDQVDLEQDQVLVFRRNDDGSRTAEPADAARLRTFLDEFMLGEVWFNQGEEGLVGKGA